MNIWGIGANWGGESMLSEFQSKSAVGIGWSEEEAPALYAMMEEIANDDIIYVKSFKIKNKELVIKAVGTVKKTMKCSPAVFGENHGTVCVEWRDGSFDKEISHTVTKAERKYNVYLNTLYREYNPEILKKILDF